MTPDERETVDRYRWFTSIATRWGDNDVFGHVNNVVFYSYFDSAVNLYLIREGGFDIHAGAAFGVVAESRCAFREPVAYPDVVRVGVRVDKLGSRSVTYGVAVFREDAAVASADGHLVHVFVDRATRRPVPIPEPLRNALSRIGVR